MKLEKVKIHNKQGKTQAYIAKAKYM